MTTTDTAERQGGRQRPRSLAVRLVVTGWLAFPVSVVVAALSMNYSAVIATPIPPMVVLVGMAIAVWRTRRLFWLSMVFGVLYGAFHVLILDSFSLSHPDSFPDFFPAAIRAVGAASVVVGSAIGISQRRAGGLRPTGRAARRVLVGRAVLVAVAGVGSLVATIAAASGDDRMPGASTVVMTDDRFEGDLDVGGEAKAYVVNEDWYAHTFTIDGAVDVYVGPRAKRLIDLSSLPPGTYDLVCAVTGHEDMVEELTVEAS